jgi:hypothetical protein
MGKVKKYRFEVTYSNKFALRVSDFMSRLDLGTGNIVVTDVVTFSSTSKGISIKQYKDKLKEGFELDGGTVWEITGGLI